MGKANELTTIAIYKSSKKLLDSLKEYPEQSYAKQMVKLLKEVQG